MRSAAVFIRDWNLWVMDIATRQERQLTTDGVKYFGYATDNAGWSSSDRAIALWSPDSRKIATQQQDEREVGEMYLVSTAVGHPTLRVSKFPLPGDKVMAMLHRVVIDVDSGRVVRLQMEPDFHRATLGDDINVRDYNWSPDSSKLALASVSRDHKQVWLRVADTATGTVRTVLEEKVATQFESRTGWQVLWNSGEVIWHSERDNWGQLYLYDLSTGKLKNQITSGDGPVMQIARVDEKARTLTFGANGREKGQDPYFLHFYRTGLDGKGNASLTPDDGTHAIQLSPSGKYLIDTYSKPDAPPVVVLRDGEGKLVMPLERTDISKLLATGWKPPTPIKMMAADGKTEIYGLMFTPTKMDPARKYPVVNNVYPGPQTGSTGARTFTPARGDRQALAELGFIVVTIDGRGTPGRSKAFQDSYYGAMGRDNTIPDQIAGMKELAKKYPFIDLERAGIWGHSGGGFATTTAMFRFPGFFKVGIAESGNHDQRTNEDDWGERYQGLVVKNADGTDNYDAEANQNFAKNLTGKLLLGARNHGYERAAVSDVPGSRRPHQGQQGLRPPDAAQPEPRLRHRLGLHDAAPVGLLRQVAPGCRAAEGISDEVNRTGSLSGRNEQSLMPVGAHHLLAVEREPVAGRRQEIVRRESCPEKSSTRMGTRVEQDMREFVSKGPRYDPRHHDPGKLGRRERRTRTRVQPVQRRPRKHRSAA